MDMSRLKLQTPQGTRDYLPAECAEKRRVENAVRTEFLRNGYLEIETPSFEYYDVFTHDAVPYVQENMIKFFDLKGRILALRPDSTGPIARMAVTKLLEQQDVLRLFYIQNAFGFLGQGLTGKTEFTQAGVELIGENGAQADAEVIALAIQSLLNLGLKGFKIDIGQVGYFKALMNECELDERSVEKIRTLVDTKNNVELEYELDRLSINGTIKKTLLKLGGLFGGLEVLLKAEQLAGGQDSLRAVENVREVYEILQDFGYQDYLSIDLGMLNNFNYYSGLTFRGIAPGLGGPLLSGGRYDGLLREFGKDVPATGFAMGMIGLLTVLEKQGMLRCEEAKTLVLRCDETTRKEAYQKALMHRSYGRKVLLEFNKDREYDCGLYDVEEI